MHKRLTTLFICLCLTACGTPTQPDASKATKDALGDAFGQGTGINWDLTELTTRTNDTNLFITLEFAQEVKLASQDGPATGQDLTGYLFFDTDQNPQTPQEQAEFEAFLNLVCPKVLALGSDYYLDLAVPNPDGSLPIYFFNDQFEESGSAAASVQGKKLSLTIPLKVIDKATDEPELDIGLELGNANEPTDCAPDSGKLSN